MDEYKTFYLAYAIDQNTPDPPERDVLDLLRTGLVERGNIIYEPQRAFRLRADSTSEETALDMNSWFIHRINSFALKQADLRVFIISDAPSWGLPLELMDTVNQCLPFVVLNLTEKRVLPHYLRVLLLRAKAMRMGVVDGEPWFDSLKDFFINVVSMTNRDSVPLVWFSRGLS